MSFTTSLRARPAASGMAHQAKVRRKRRMPAGTTAALLAAMVAAVFAGGPAGAHWQSIAADREPTHSAQFELCAGKRVTCVVDGDTFWLESRKIRIAGIDTPEVSEPKCPAEHRLGMGAAYRPRGLLNAGEFALPPAGQRSRDAYSRELRLVVRGGQSIGNQLVSGGLAHRWRGGKETWC